MRVKLGDQVLTQLRTEIQNGTLPVGARLDEQSIAQRFQVSRTPAREALRGLAALGLVQTLPRQGAIVRGLSAREYVAMVEILTELEGLAARLATRRMTLAERQALTPVHARVQDAARRDDVQDYAKANADFHQAIYAGSRNEILGRQIRDMRHRMGALANPFLRPGRLQQSCREHASVLAAIQAGDEAGAYAAMVEHITAGGSIYADLVAAMPAELAATPSRNPRPAAD
ncbi:GntR family transcriptional regulator [Verticiella sediminum]|uniref:GntR family transcriptional regulator n=1 Tax=Verticiella sediminum TaxID=1247510 RepID=A0A556AQ70_9BURK|nr:GntR family transcriptional regulator [Verticiella sediminum]TSH95036.1 GntR family transcriptional regulator [Verticiella sediminum]